MESTPPTSGADNLGVGIGFDSGDQVEIVADGGLVGAELGPLVADKADALGGGEAGFNAWRQAPRRRWA